MAVILKLKPNDFHRPGEREDYSVRFDGEVIGRIYSGADAMAALKAQWLRENGTAAPDGHK